MTVSFATVNTTDTSAEEHIFLRNMSLINGSISKSDITVFPTLDESFDFNAGKSIFGYGWSNTNWELFEKDGVKGAKVTSQKNGKTPMFDETTATDSSFAFKIYLDSSGVNEKKNQCAFYLRRSESGSDNFGLKLTFDDNQAYLNWYNSKGEIQSKYFGYTETSYFNSTPLGRWTDVEVLMLGDNVAISFDGKIVFFADGVKYDFTTTRTSLLWAQAPAAESSSVGGERQIAIADIKLQSLDGLKKAVDSTAAVTFDENGIADSTKRATAIAAGEKLFYNIDKTYLRNNTNYLEVYYDYGDVNTDGSTDICDMVRLNKIIDAPDNKTVKSDINRDNKHDATDLTLLREYILG